MAKHSWTNRIVPPIVFIGVVGCVWYGIASKPELTSNTPDQQTVSAAPKTVNAKQESIANIAPVVSKQGTQLQFSVQLNPTHKVQKVEFYVESKLVGAAFSEPYMVSVSENDLVAGTHTVTAKVYTGSTTTQTTPSLFTANPTSPPPLSNDTDTEQTVVTVTTTQQTQTVTTPVVGAPTNLTAQANTDGTAAQISWTEVNGAVQYQVWRDGVQIDTTSSAGYTDNNLSPGHTYDYQVIAVNGGGVTSAPSAQVAVTMPTPAVPPAPPAANNDNPDVE